MPVVYQLADAAVHALARDVMAEHHAKRLIMPDGDFVKLCIMFAFGDVNSDEPAVKLHGYPCAAVVSIIPYKQRVDKRADAEIIIDRSQWDAMTDLQRRALLDHEITHLEFQKDDVGCVKTDDVGRPKLTMRLHDWQLGGFREIAQRYGEDAIEVVNAKAFKRDYGEAVFAGGGLFAKV